MCSEKFWYRTNKFPVPKQKQSQKRELCKICQLSAPSLYCGSEVGGILVYVDRAGGRHLMGRMEEWGWRSSVLAGRCYIWWSFRKGRWERWGHTCNAGDESPGPREWQGWAALEAWAQLGMDGAHGAVRGGFSGSKKGIWQKLSGGFRWIGLSDRNQHRSNNLTFED